MDTNAILIGMGSLSWPRMERVSDRYGSIGVYNEDSTEKTVCKGANLNVATIQNMAGNKGQLIAKIIETRKSTHIGDLFRGFFPSMPGVGEEIVLGDGRLFHAITDGVDTVGLLPEDGRASDWLNPENLYRAHEQTIELYFLPS